MEECLQLANITHVLAIITIIIQIIFIIIINITTILTIITTAPFTIIITTTPPPLSSSPTLCHLCLIPKPGGMIIADHGELINITKLFSLPQSNFISY